MERIRFSNCSALAEKMIDYIENNENITAILYYEEAAKTTKELLRNDNVQIADMSISADEFNDYFREYYVSLLKIDDEDDYSLFVEPAWRNAVVDKDGAVSHPEGYCIDETDVAFVCEDAHSSILNCIGADSKFEISFDNKEIECDGNCENCIDFERELVLSALDESSEITDDGTCELDIDKFIKILFSDTQ